MGFFEKILGGPVLTYDYKWLRVAATGASSTIHCDAVYMGRGTSNLYSCWTPLGDVPLEMGPIVLWLGSQRLEKIKQTYARMDVDRDLIQGWFSDDPAGLVDKFGGRWASSNFQAGDVIIFGIYLLHASLGNSTNHFRLSVDTRYQLATEPADERWIGEKPPGHYAFQRPGATLEPIEQTQARWKL
jgi:ectoine hydroxylase-related dioxygenase (phytanoyl-CoA dioxygenase family)